MEGGSIVNDLGFGLHQITGDDLALKPAVFQNETDGYGELMQYACWIMLFPDGVEEKPLYFMRNFNVDSFRWMGIINPGDTVVDHQTEAHVHDLAQGDARVTPYHLEDPDTDTYVICSEEPYAFYSFSPKGGHWVEGRDGCVFDLTFEPMGFSSIEHVNSPRGSGVLLNPVMVTGTYEGRPVKGMGGWDRTFRPQNMTAADTNKRSFAYITSYLNGIREDGRKELVYTLISTYGGRNGKGIGIYCIDGEEPVVTDQVYLENGVFRRLPYLPEGDHTVALAAGTWKFGGKEFHLDCRWGGKGYTAGPRIERIGQSQTYGRWYEGKEPYKQELYGFFTELMDVSEELVTALGFTVTD